MIPFSLLPFTPSGILFGLLMIASVPVALRIIGVRDYRCYGIALLSAPLANAVAVGAISPMLVVGVALLWRYRDRALVAAAAAAAIIMLKLFLWPFLFWLAFTRRWKAALISVALMALVTIGSWAMLGFASFRDYPHILNILTHLLEGKGYSLVALGLSLGAGTGFSRALPWIVGGAAIGLIALRGRTAGADRWTFVVAMGAAFALSPIVWLHYFVLLYIPIGIARPRLSWLWALPLALWVCRGQSVDGALWDAVHKHKDLALTPRVGSAGLIVFAIAVVSSVIVLSARASQRTER
jgi:alpha-1,2-mannosyltransferase